MTAGSRRGVVLTLPTPDPYIRSPRERQRVRMRELLLAADARRNAAHGSYLDIAAQTGPDCMAHHGFWKWGNWVICSVSSWVRLRRSSQGEVP